MNTHCHALAFYESGEMAKQMWILVDAETKKERKGQ